MPATPSISHAASAAMLAITSLATRTAPSAPFSPIKRQCYALKRSLSALHVRLRSGIDADHVAGLDEQRHLDRGPGLEPGRFCRSRNRVALEPWIGPVHLH